MTVGALTIPASSQTVGPYFRIGLEYLIERAPEVTTGAEGTIEIRGRVLDRDGAPVPDAMLEFWAGEPSAPALNNNGYPAGFTRAATDDDGNFTLVANRPTALAFGVGRMQAPHLLVLVFARGLNRHLITRVYFNDETSNAADPVLEAVPTERRDTLIAQLDGNLSRSYRWNVVLQGQDETVFFAW